MAIAGQGYLGPVSRMMAKDAGPSREVADYIEVSVLRGTDLRIHPPPAAVAAAAAADAIYIYIHTYKQNTNCIGASEACGDRLRNVLASQRLQ